MNSAEAMPTCVSGLLTCFLFWALLFTRSASKDTEDATVWTEDSLNRFGIAEPNIKVKLCWILLKYIKIKTNTAFSHFFPRTTSLWFGLALNPLLVWSLGKYLSLDFLFSILNLSQVKLILLRILIDRHVHVQLSSGQDKLGYVFFVYSSK